MLFDPQVIFELEGVFIHPSPDEAGTDQDLLLSGSLRILEKVRIQTVGVTSSRTRVTRLFVYRRSEGKRHVTLEEFSNVFDV